MTKKGVTGLAAVALVFGAASFWRYSPTSTERSDRLFASGGKGSVTPADAGSPSAKAPFSVAAALSFPSTNLTASVRGTKPYFLTGIRPFDRPLRLAAEALGARTKGVLSRSRLLVEATPEACVRLRADGRFSSLEECVPSAKIAKSLMDELASGAESVDVVLVTLAADDRLSVRARVEALGGELVKGWFNSGDKFAAHLSRDALVALAGQGDVRWMERFVRPRFTNDFAVEPAAMDVRSLWASAAAPDGLSGAGQIITTSDSGIDLTHQDLTNRVVAHRVADGCVDHDGLGHGTHTAGSIAGDGTCSEGKIRGTAWGASLYAWFCGKDGDRGIYMPDSIAELFRPDQANYPAYIHSASWGGDTGGEYTSDCQDIDEYVWLNPEFLPVFSAGNAGSGLRTIGSPAAAKNVLAVGATQNLRKDEDYPAHDHPTGDPARIADFSSRGPCRDGRIKPDIAAPGVAILSTRAYNQEYGRGCSEDGNYAYECGTSMSCPLTAGAVALVREWLMRSGEFADEDGKRPTAALMKAVVCGGASRDSAKPDNLHGWGNVSLAETICPSNRVVKLYDRLPFAEGTNFVWIFETTNRAPFDVQLAWVDCPGDIYLDQSLPVLVNDLDLTVEPIQTGEGDVFHGNGGSGPDALNNMESVRLAEAEPDLYLVTVRNTHILYDHTEGGAAALYVRGAIAGEVDPKDAVCVRIEGDETLYFSFESALAAAREITGRVPVLEIVRPVTLRKSVTIDFDCTLLATNGNASLSSADGVTVTVDGGAVLALGGRLGLGEIELADGRLKLVGDLAEAIYVRAQWQAGYGDVFGSSSLTLEAAQTAARKFVNALDDELAGEAYVDADGSVGIRWGAAEVSDEDARVRFVSEDGAVTNNYRSLRLLFRMLADSGRIELLADCPLVEPATIPAGKSVVMFSAGEDPFVVDLPASDTWKTNALVSVCGSISVMNVVFDGSGMPPGGGSLSLFRILNGASVELGASAGIRAVTLVPQSGDNKKVQGVVYVLRGGEFQMDDGSFVTDCSGGSGAAIYLSQSGAAARLMGGRIEGCVHPHGAVYGNASGATIEVSGGVTVKGNGNGSKETFNITPQSAGDLKLVGALTGTETVGVNLGNADGKQFGVVVAGGDSADHFVCDTKTAKGETLLGSASNGTLVWKATVVVPPPNVEVGGKTYGTLEDAVAAAADGDTLTILAPIAVSSMPVRIDRALTITASDPTNVIRRGASGELSVNTVARAIEIASTGVVFRNIVLGDDDREWPRAFVHVLEGGELTLGEGAVVRNVRATAMMREGRMEPIGRSAAGVLVAGTLIMEDGSAIVSCVNRFDQSAGGGVLASGSGATFDFRGGTVSGCSASRGGGVCIEKHAKALVRGGGTILDNANGNLYVAAESPLEIADVFTGRIDYREGVVRPDTETNIFADVTYDYADDLDALAAGAIRFTNELTRACGVAVTNGAGAASYIWNTALATSTTYEKDDNRWAPIGEVPPQPVPQVTTEVDPPTAVPGLVYNAQVQKGVLAADGYTVTGGEAVNAGDYTAVVALRPNYVWRGGTTDSLEVPWSIAKATYDMSGVVFTNVTYVYDGSVKSNLVDTATLPDGVRVTGYENNGQTEIGDHTVTAHFAGDEVNHNPIPDMTAKLTIVAEPTPPGPTPGPHWEVVTNHPTKIAFRSIDRVSDTEWALVVTNRVRYCNYRLIWTTDLTQGFTTTGDWEHVVHEGCAVWATNVTTTGGAWFWRAEGADGTNMVLKAEE